MAGKRSLMIFCMAGIFMVCTSLPALAEHHGDHDDRDHHNQEQHHNDKDHHDKDHHDDKIKIILQVPPLFNHPHDKVIIIGRHDDERWWEGEKGRFAAFADRLDLSREQRVRVRRVVGSDLQEGEDIRDDLRRDSRRVREGMSDGKRPGKALREKLQRDWNRYFLYQHRTLSRLEPVLASKQEQRLLHWMEKGYGIDDVFEARLDLTRGQRKKVYEILRDFREDNKDLIGDVRKTWRAMARDAFDDRSGRSGVRRLADRWSEGMTTLTVREGRLFRRLAPFLTRRQRDELDDLFGRPLICLDYRGY